MLATWLASLVATAALASEVWLHRGAPTPQAQMVVQSLADAASYGLRPRDYDIGLSREEWDALADGVASAAVQARFDAALSDAAGRFATHLRCGRVSAREAGFNLPVCRLDAREAALQLAGSADAAASLAEFEPRAAPYRRLKNALGAYRELAERFADQQLPPLPARAVRATEQYAGAAQLRTLLAALGDLSPEAAAAGGDAPSIDAALAEAIGRFQLRHGLEPDGVLGVRTFAALEQPLQTRVGQLELALERWRWLSAIDRPDIVVNVPLFMLYALAPPERPDAALEMSVIVGQSDPHTRTPVFMAELQRVVFNPYWDVPTSILQRELLPLIRKNPGYIERHDMEIVRGPGDDAAVVETTAAAIEALAAGELRLRQRPGPQNALGPIKFVLPNPYSVYLHSTPDQRLFARTQRAFSHGCIRVSEPAALAQYVLRNAPDEWSVERIEAALCDGRMRRVELATPLSVVIYYVTAAATAKDGVLFAQDLYGYDRKLAALLARAPSPILPRSAGERVF